MSNLFLAGLNDFPDWAASAIISVAGFLASLVVYRIFGSLDKRYVRIEDYNRDQERQTNRQEEFRQDTKKEIRKLEVDLLESVEKVEQTTISRINDVKLQSENQHREIKTSLNEIRQDQNLGQLNLVQAVSEMRGELKVIVGKAAS